MLLPFLLLAFQQPTFRAEVNLVHAGAEVSRKGSRRREQRALRTCGKQTRSWPV